VFVTLDIQHAKRMRRIIICDLSISTVFSHIISYTVFEKKKVIEHEMCFDFLYNVCLKHVSFYEELSEI